MKSFLKVLLLASLGAAFVLGLAGLGVYAIVSNHFVSDQPPLVFDDAPRLHKVTPDVRDAPTTTTAVPPTPTTTPTPSVMPTPQYRCVIAEGKVFCDEF